VRRDLRPLADRGSVVRVHGAVGLAGQLAEAPFQRRMRENAEAKQRIARHLAATIRNGESLLLDTGTTTSFLARELLRHQRLTVVTNSSDAARILAPSGGNRVFLAGGEVRGDSGAILGAAAIDFVSRFTVMHAVISAGSVGPAGVMDYDPDEADFARAVLSRGTRRVVLTDRSKFGRHALVTVCPLEGLDELVTDAPPAGALAAALAGAGVTVTVAAGAQAQDEVTATGNSV
jgi:DeoR family transcriptional regulator, glycerol-3-phosphate regulon repressor